MSVVCLYGVRSLLPVQVFFYAIPDKSFIDILHAFKNGHGAGFNDAFCGFPGEEEYNEPTIEGIEFAIKGEEEVSALLMGVKDTLSSI